MIRWDPSWKPYVLAIFAFSFVQGSYFGYLVLSSLQIFEGVGRTLASLAIGYLAVLRSDHTAAKYAPLALHHRIPVRSFRLRLTGFWFLFDLLCVYVLGGLGGTMFAFFGILLVIGLAPLGDRFLMNYFASLTAYKEGKSVLDSMTDAHGEEGTPYGQGGVSTQPVQGFLPDTSLKKERPLKGLGMPLSVWRLYSFMRSRGLLRPRLSPEAKRILEQRQQAQHELDRRDD